MATRLFIVTVLCIMVARAPAQPPDIPSVAQALRNGSPVAALSDTTVICEAEEFQVQSPGWQAKPFGTN